MLGTVQEAEVFQLPQSTNPVELVVWQAGWVCGRLAEGWMLEAISRAPSPL